jgi:hypothetical protein
LPEAMTRGRQSDDPLPGSSRQLGRWRFRITNHAAAERGEPAVIRSVIDNDVSDRISGPVDPRGGRHAVVGAVREEHKLAAAQGAALLVLVGFGDLGF